MTPLLRHFLLFTVCLLTAWHSAAQEAASSTSQPIQPEAITQADTLPLLFSLVLSPEKSTPVEDTLPDANFRQYNPARRSLIDWGTLGNLGSSARPLWFAPESRVGFATGLRPFDLYRFRPEDLRFYRHKRTFSEVTYTRGRTQEDGQTLARLSRTFEGGLNFALDYRTINNLGEFRNQRDKHNSLSLGVWYPVSKRYEFFLLLVNNTFRQRDNGGIRSDFDLNGPGFNGPISLPINLSNEEAKSKQVLRELQYTHFLTFGDPKKRAYRGSHTLRYSTESWKFSDTETDNDDARAFYDTFLVDERGLRNFLRVRRLDNVFLLNTFKSKQAGQTTDGFSAGLRHALIWSTQEPRSDSLVNNLFLTGQLAITPSERFQFLVDGDLGLLSNTLEYRLNATLRLGLGPLGALQASLLSQRRPPDLLHSKLWVSQRSFWQNNWEKPVENSLSATYTLPRIGFSATAQTHLVSQYLYYDQTGMPAQLSGSLSVNQLLLQENFKIGPLRSTNTVGFQVTNRNDVVHLPTWFTKNSLFVERKLFKRQMLTTLGVDFRMNSTFQPDSYLPLTGQFHLQDTVDQKPYLWLDGVVAVKIRSFRFFFRMENLASYWQPNSTVFYQTAWQPQPFATFRLGFNWRFLDGNQNTGNSNPSNNSAPPGVGGSSGIPRF